MTSKTVLMIASHFPPNAPGGVMRVVKLAKYLSRSGWRSIVLTSGETDARFAGDFASDLPFDLQVVRVASWDPRKPFAKLKARFPTSSPKESVSTNGKTPPSPSLGARVFVPDYLMFWIPRAIIAGYFKGWSGRVAAIFSTSPLPSSHLVAYCLKLLLRVPWILDLRDPWTTNPFAAPKSFRVLDALDRALESRAFRAADCITVVAEQFVEPIVQRHKNLQRSKFVVVPNGFDPDDFSAVQPIVFDRFTIVHAGTFYESRSSRPFLEALAALLESDPPLRHRIHVTFVGPRDAETERTVAARDLDGVVSMTGAVSHAESLRYIVGASLLLLVPGEGAGTMTGKIFEYIAARRPILALAGEGAVRDLIDRGRLGRSVYPNDIDAIAAALREMIGGASGETPAEVSPELAERFSRRRTAEQIAAILNREVLS
jgi:glycosyltransferase involved in cell wall biosynthesis